MSHMDIAKPNLEKRLQARYHKLVLEHTNANSETAAGLRALPGQGKAFASTQGAWRFYANPKVSLQALGAPLLAQGAALMRSDCRRYALVMHDWSQLAYEHQQHNKSDLIELGKDLHGYELLSALLVSDVSGLPLGTLNLSLTASTGTYATWQATVQPRQAPLDELSASLQSLRNSDFPLDLVHLIDRQANSVYHWRLWGERGDRFVARADDRWAHWQEQRLRLSEIAQQLPWRADKAVALDAQNCGQIFVAEAAVVFKDPAYRRGPNGKRQVIKGEPFAARLVVMQLRLLDETVIAEWYLVTNLPTTVLATVIAEWYYWRWTIESAFKLYKSAGLHLEDWQQESAAATAKRLLVASMACLIVWQVQRSETPQMEEFRQLLLRLSGRQIRPGQAPAPALLAGVWVLLAILDVLQSYDLKELLELAALLPAAQMIEQVNQRQGFSP